MLEEYIKNVYNDNSTWFVDEVKKGEHLHRISKVFENKNYLNGQHKILQREDGKYKGEEYITKKLVLNQAKTILNFHSTYLLGKPLSLGGSEEKVKVYQNIYRRSNYNNIDFKILDYVNKYGDSYEYVYVDDNVIKSKIIKSEDGYPVYNDNMDYIGFIEHYTVNNIDYYTIYSFDTVEEWTNEGGEGLRKIGEFENSSGLPIHYSNCESEYDNFGRSILEDIKPLLDEIEDILSKMSDSIYTLSLNPLPVITGQKIENTISADVTGYALSLDDGAEFSYKNAEMDYSTIKLYLDELHKQLNVIASMPSIVGGNTNVANVSEVSLKLLYQLADVQAMMSEKWFREGLYKRFKMFDRLLVGLGITFNDDEYVDVEFTYSRPVNTSELLDNIKKQREMNAISIKTIIEKSNLTVDVQQEIERLKNENNINSDSDENIEGEEVKDMCDNQ